MKKKQLSISVLGVCFLMLLTSVPTYAQGNDFFAHYNQYLFHDTGISPRSMGMGGAYSALRGLEMGNLGNPAALGWQESYFIHLNGSYAEVTSDVTLQDPDLAGIFIDHDAEADIYSGLIGGAIPFEWGGIGLMYRYRDDEINNTGDYLFATESHQYESELERHQGSIGGAYKVMDQLSIGYRYSYIDYDNDVKIDRTRPANLRTELVGVEEEFEGHNNQFGLQYILNDQWSFGLDGSYGFGDLDLGGRFLNQRLRGEADAESWSIRAGASWYLMPDIPLLLALDLNYEERSLDDDGFDRDEELFGIHLGAEYEIIDHFFLRAGYQFEDIELEDRSPYTSFDIYGNGLPPIIIDESVSFGSYSAGLGYNIGQLNIDYAFIWADTASDDHLHYFGLGFSF
jgi:opacity protein-like surface antigen